MKYRLITLLMLLTSLSVLSQKKETGNFDGVEDIHLATSSGSARIVKGSGKTVRVILEHTYESDEFEFKMDQNGTRLTLEERHLRNWSTGESNWTLEIPDGMDVRFSTGSGNLEVQGLNLELKSNLGSGDVYLTDTKGYMRATTGSGSHIIRNHDGDLDLTTGSGDIEVTSVSGDLEFTTGSGDISVNKATGDVTATVGSGEIEARGIELASSGRFTSGSGDVEVFLQGDTEASITIASGSGDSKLSFGGGTINASITMEANERYGRIIAPFDFDSEEVIRHSGNHNDTIRKTVKLGTGKADIRVLTGSGVAEIKK